MKIYDAAVIGAGPAGITAALYLVRSGRSVILFEKLTPGGQVLLTDSLENYPGFPKGVKGWELADAFAAHLEGQPVDRSTATVTAVTGSAGNFTLKTSDGDINARTVIAASGATHRRLGVKDEDRLLGHGVSYCAVCDGNFFRGKKVVVIGGGNTAAADAIYLSRICEEVTVVYRRDTLRATHVYHAMLEGLENVRFEWDSLVTEAYAKEGKLSGVKVENVKTKETKDLACEGMFVAIGTIPNTEFLAGALELDEHGYIVAGEDGKTSVPGVFAAGDVRTKALRQVATAVGDGANVAEEAAEFVAAHR